MIEHYFIVHQILEVFFAKRILFKIEVKSTDRLARWLVIWEMQLLQVLMAQGCLDSNSIFWVIGEHFLKKVNCVSIGSFEKLVEILTIALRQLLNKFFILLIVYFTNQLRRWISKELGYHVELLFLRASWQQRFPDDQLC